MAEGSKNWEKGVNSMTVGGSHSTSSTMTSFFIQEWYPIWSSTPHLTKMVLNPSTGTMFAQSSQSTKVEGSNPGPGLPVYILCVLSEYSWSLLHSKDMHKHRFNGDEIFLKCQRERKFFFSKTYIKNRMHWFSNAFQPIFNWWPDKDKIFSVHVAKRHSMYFYVILPQVGYV